MSAWDKPQTISVALSQPVSKSLGQAILNMQDSMQEFAHSCVIPGVASHGIEDYLTAQSAVTVMGNTAIFQGRDVSQVEQRMPFVYETAQSFMQAATTGNPQTAQQRILQDQTRVITNTWKDTRMPIPRTSRWIRDILCARYSSACCISA